MPKATINRFNGGMINDPRIESSNSAMVMTNFVATVDQSRLIPAYATEDDYSSQSTAQMQNFCVGYRASSAYVIFGLGVVSGTGRASILYKNIADIDDTLWSTPAYNESSSGTTSFNLFVYYHKTRLIYGARAGTHIWAFDTTAVSAFADTHQALSYTNIAQGLVHSKDDILYIPYDNKIAKNDNGSWNTTALTLPTHLYITSISEYGNYLAIACAPLSGVGNSRLFLWDRNTSITTVSESIDLGQGNVKIVEEVDGTLVAVILFAGISGVGRGKLLFRVLSGNQMVIVKEYSINYGDYQFPLYKAKYNGKLYFMSQLTINGATREGIFSFGRTSVGAPFTLCQENTLNNSTTVTSATLRGFAIFGDYIFMSYQESGTYKLKKTDRNNYTTAIYESLMNPGMASSDRSKKKQLVGVAVTHQPLTSGQTVVLKYRVDSASTGGWTTVFTSSTVGATRFESGLDGSGNQFTAGLDYEFRLESTAGAVITGLSYVYENLETLV